MSRAFVLPAIATLALFGAAAPIEAVHAANCLAAPKPPAPQGQHWYYRTDRNLGRKCWYLAEVGRKGKAVAPQVAADDDDAEAETDTKPNAKPTAPVMAEAAARLTEPLRSPPPPPPPAADWTIAQATPRAPLIAAPAEPAPSSETAVAPVAQQAVVPAAPEPVVDQPAPAVAAPAPVAAVAPPAAAPERINLMQFVFVAFVGLCLIAGLLMYLAAIRRRREIRIVDLNTPPALRMPAALTDSPSVAPDASEPREDAEIDAEPRRRFARSWTERAA